MTATSSATSSTMEMDRMETDTTLQNHSHFLEMKTRVSCSNKLGAWNLLKLSGHVGARVDNEFIKITPDSRAVPGHAPKSSNDSEPLQTWLEPHVSGHADNGCCNFRISCISCSACKKIHTQDLDICDFQEHGNNVTSPIYRTRSYTGWKGDAKLSGISHDGTCCLATVPPLCNIVSENLFHCPSPTISDPTRWFSVMFRLCGTCIPSTNSTSSFYKVYWHMSLPYPIFPQNY